MRTLLKATLARAYAAGGGLRRRHEGKLVVLTFHRVRPVGDDVRMRTMRNLDVAVPDFRALLAWMRARYEPLALCDWIGRTTPLPRPSFAVTFDDGWADNGEHAFPVLRELEIPATIFLSTGAIENRMPFWWQMPGLTDAEIEHLKHQSHALLEARLAENPDFRKAHAGDFLTWDQIREMGRGGLIDFGVHGHQHVLLDQVSREEALADIRQCWTLLQERIPGRLLPALAWPNGNARGDIGAELRALGLQAAFGTWRGAVATPGPEPWDLPRNNVDRNTASQPGLWPWMLLRAR